MVCIICHQRRLHTHRMGGTLVIVTDTCTRIQIDSALVCKQVNRYTHLRVI